jgi:predicted NAD/FAD-binding protein
MKIVFNPSTYPNFLRFLAQYSSIVIEPTEMTLSVSRDFGAFEWAGDTIRTVFCQLSRIVDGEMWALLYDVARFNASARKLIASWNNQSDHMDTRSDFSIGEYLEREKYSQSFRDNYLIVSDSSLREVER